MISSNDWLLDDRVQNLLAEWTDRRDAGEPVTVDELCADNPELAERLSSAIEMLTRTEWMIESSRETESIASPPEEENSVRICDLSSAISYDELVRGIKSLGTVPGETLRSSTEIPGSGDSTELARRLLDSGQLTSFQLRQIIAGRSAELLLSDYVLLEPIGEGGMGRVFRAMHRTMHRIVAVKIMRLRPFHSEDAIERFRREIQAVARLNHPHIVSAYDAGEDGGRHFLVMEFIDGLDLGSLVQSEGPLEVHRAVDYVLQAARGLEFAHQHGVVHRDVKPSNLLLDSSGTVKILDLGLARMDSGFDAESDAACSELTGSGQVMGTIDYLAPEQALDSRHADERSDIYSLGCTLFRLLHDRALFDHESVVKRIIAHQSAEIPSLCLNRDDIPVSLNRIFLSMVAKNPADRYRNMGGVISDLEAVERMPVCLPETPERRFIRPMWICVSVIAVTFIAFAARNPLMQNLFMSRGTVRPSVEKPSASLQTTIPQVILVTPDDAQVRADAVRQPEPDWAIPFSQRIAENPRDVEAYWLRARGYVGVRRFQDAIDDCETALRVDPNCRSAYFWRGLARMNFDQYEPALADFRQSLKMREDDDWCLRHTAWILVAGPVELRNSQEARKLAFRAVELARERKRSSYYACLEVLAAAHYRLDELDTALEKFDEVIAADTGQPSPRARLFKAMCLSRLGMPEQARSTFEEAVRVIGQQQPDTLGDPAPIQSEAAMILNAARR